MSNSQQRQIAACRSCGAQIYWFKTKRGKNCPVDAGTVTQKDIGDTSILFDHTRHEAHFATCPNADQHRKTG